MILLILFLSFLKLFQSKNLLFPFKKLTIEYLNKTKTISDFIDYNVYINITMGTPKKPVAHFIGRDIYIFFSYNLFFLHYSVNKEYEKIENIIENSLNLYYTPDNSTSFDIIDKAYQAFSDEFSLYDLNNTEKKIKLNFTMNEKYVSRKLYGQISLNNRGEPSALYNIYLFKMLKEKELIDETYFTFFYGDYDVKFGSNYLNDDYNSFLGNLILGESPHEFIPDNFKKKDEIKINSQFELILSKITIKSKKANYSEENIKLKITFTSALIRGSIVYKNVIDKIFFNDLISKNICRADIVEEHINWARDIIYSCENNNFMKDKIKTFPTLYFELKQYNLTFLFTYEELFQLHNNRLYFLIYFAVVSSNSKWQVGELFLRKYITSFNYYSKTISFYKNQVDDINNKTYKIIPDEEPYVNPDPSKKDDNKIKTWIIVVIIVCSVIFVGAIITIVLLVLKLKKYRKKRADELVDDNYEYTAENNIN